MRIAIAQLAQQLKQGLHPFYFIYGEEPFFCREAIEQIRQEGKRQGYTERECYEITSHFDWEALKASFNVLTLFSNKRLIECQFSEDKISKIAGQALLDIASAPPPDTLFLCSAGKLDTSLKKSAWFIALERQVTMLWARPLSREAFVQWLKDRLRKAQLSISEEVFTILVERTERNLLAAAQAVEKLALYFHYPVPEQQGATNANPATRELSVEAVKQLVCVDTQFSVFDLVSALLMGSISRTKQIFFSLKDEGIEPLLIVWAITREVRTIIPLASILEKGGSLAQGFREQKVWQHNQEGIRIFLKRASLSFLHHCLVQAKHLDDLLKGQRPGDAWEELYAWCLMLARGWNVKSVLKHQLCRYNGKCFLT